MSSEKCCNWSITINNPTDDDNRQWACLKDYPWVKEVQGQLEKGKDGTLHIQGMIKTQSVRFAQVKKALPRAHIEPAKNVNALRQYVNKTETRVAAIAPVKVATQSDVQRVLLESIMLTGFRHYEWTGDPINCFNEFLAEKELQIKNDWEIWTDAAVSKLIREGYYGVEFVMSNPQVRTAFRKYLPDILYRTYNAPKIQSTNPVAPQEDVQFAQDEEEVRSSESVYEGEPATTYHEDVQA